MKVVFPFVRSAYNYDLKEASDLSGLDCSCDGAGRTKQSFAEEADINTLIRRFGIGNPLPQGTRVPSFGDFNGVTDYQTALNLIDRADRAFMGLPAHLRTRFGNDPASFVAFCDDDANRDEAVRLGMVPAPVVAPLDEPPAEV
ncbi:MAG: hypothetical protein EBU49_14630 [Proteobacteria bacterium]|nr:hypothetical protein [Pseudomonadota bacterium]